MKARQIIALSVIAAVGFTACEKNLYDPEKSQDDNLLVTDLVVPGDFDWKMAENATCTVASARAIRASIYSDESLNEKSLLATTVVKSGGGITLPLSLLKKTENVYVQYEDATGVKNVVTAPVGADGKIDFTVPASLTRALTDDGFFATEPTVLYYPGGDFGTVMFEDNYPELGDYDFNDFVADYQIRIETEPGYSNRINKITLIMEVKAIGANQKTHNYVPHIGMPIPQDFLESVTVSTRTPFNNSSDEVVVKNVTNQTEKRNYMAFAFNGAEKNSRINQESTFLNTELGFITENTKSFVVDFVFKKTPVGKQYADLGYIKADGFDIFLATPDHKREIHMLGQYHVFTSDQSEYKNKDNFVWGINIPSATVQAIENVDFLKAYPMFKNWVTGLDSTPWYKQGAQEYLFSYK